MANRNCLPIIPLDEAIEKYKEAKEAWECAVSRTAVAKASEEYCAEKLAEARSMVKRAAKDG